MAEPISTGLAIGGAVANLAGGLLGGGNDRRAARRAQQANEARYSQALALGQGSLARTREGTRFARAILNDPETGLAATSTRMLGEADRLGNSGRQQILERETQQLARDYQGARSRGLANTTYLDAVRRGTRLDTNRALIDLDSRIASTRLDALGRVGNASLNLANFETGAAASENAQTQALINTITNRTDTASPSGTGTLGLLGTFAGSLSDLIKDSGIFKK